jgi:hypothetical protein
MTGDRRGDTIPKAQISPPLDDCRQLYLVPAAAFFSLEAALVCCLRFLSLFFGLLSPMRVFPLSHK